MPILDAAAAWQLGEVLEGGVPREVRQHESDTRAIALTIVYVPVAHPRDIQVIACDDLSLWIAEGVAATRPHRTLQKHNAVLRVWLAGLEVVVGAEVTLRVMIAASDASAASAHVLPSSNLNNPTVASRGRSSGHSGLPMFELK